ncbi:creatininase family protein [Enhydrobacter aerosaccus]|uniref:creatininase family protein n=1 Tax=Enhydrobacter aerosaccus TaxID=225324 RepID=UPI001E4FC926|nr:creatininase family protein [Enhydrobacter aerosaccus]
MTWTEVRDALGAGTTTVIIPVGGTEQSGPHLALGKHNVRVKVLAGRIATALGDTLVAPVLAYVPEGNISPPTEHMRFPGTISVPVSAFKGTLDGAARSLRQAGFTHIVLIGDHGGYQAQLKDVADQLNRAWAGTSARAHYIAAYYRASDVAYTKLLRTQGLSEAEIGQHAGAADTSLQLAVDPSTVRSDRLEAAHGADIGVLGDARRSSAVLGQSGVDLIVNDTVAAIRKARLEKH